ncbi:hypothetical protein N657DRAFT_208331 [Parathielavia appendiculata]|uniref:Uncharacterized protein n=1 Tax=Parathielavia appendiculata TaxID=2587402 RepID=A0AAN6U7D7_9PEZI|nr:hypothetical protein N657DRAFT_208331 [Parathielavia appendiculata]
MTNKGGDHGSGPSLLQARSTHSNHNHNHHLHLHQHRRLHALGVDTAPPHIRSPPKEKLHDRQVVIVQTVSVVHYIDATGAVTSVGTLDSDTVAPTTVDLPAAVTAADLTALSDLLPSVSLSGLIPDLTDGAPSSTPSAESATSSSSVASLSASSDTLTSTLSTFSSSSSAFPTLSGVFNSSSTRISSLFGNHTIGLLSNSTRTSTSSHSTFASTLTSTSTESSGSLWTSTTDLSAPTVVAGEAGGGGNTGSGSGATPTDPVPAEPTPEAPAGLAPEQRNAVVGGVVGSVAGIALAALIFLYLLKWRRQRGQGIMLLGDGDSTARGRGFASGGPGSPGSERGMVERSGAFAIPSALAKLTGKRAIDAPPAEPALQEKGFYRVSGRKLISVLESGGDGYSDPHDSVGSASSYYRDSSAFVDNSNLQPLQLGSPMRPVSGVPVFRDGPQRTPVHEDTPLPPGYRPSAFPTTLRTPDPVGRSLTSRDGSRGSGSRFTEDA